MEERKSFAPGEMILDSLLEYTVLPEDEQLEFHVSDVRPGEGKNYNTGEPEPRIVIEAVYDGEGEANGQKYTAWFKKSLNPRSNLAKFLKPVVGEVGSGFDITDLVGLPFQATMVTVEKEGKKRQYFAAYFKPNKNQKKVDVSVKADELTEEEFNALI